MFKHDLNVSTEEAYLICRIRTLQRFRAITEKQQSHQGFNRDFLEWYLQY